jgi:hypothetical protein
VTVRRVFLILFFLVLFYKAVGPTLDWDMGWHLATGEYILEHGLPHRDVFSFTVPGREWITHEWLSQVSMIIVHRLGGLPGLILVFAGIVALTFGLMYRRSVGRPYLAAFVTLLGAFASGFTWGARPQMFNVLGLALFVFIVEGVKDRELDRRAFLLLPVLTAIWVNLHSGYLVGVVLLGVYVIGEALQQRFGQRLSHSSEGEGPDERTLDWRSIQWLAGAAVICFIAALLNPNGYRLWIYPFETLTSNAMQTYIAEWHSPDFHSPSFWPFGLMLALGLSNFVWGQQRPTWTDALLLFGTGVAGLISARHIQIFGVVSIPIVARYLLPRFANTRYCALLEGTQPPPQPTRALVVAHWLILVILGGIALVGIGRIVQKNDAYLTADFPVAAVDFIREQGLAEQRVFNNYDWGGFLVWRGVPVFVDGRADVYGDEFLRLYLQTLLIQPGWQQPLDTYAVDYVLIGQATPLGVLLTESEQWREIYQDDLAQIFVREAR